MINSKSISTCPLFRNLDLVERAQILTIGEPRSYEAEQVIFREGEPGDGLFILVSGSVRISKRSATPRSRPAVT